MIPLRDGGYRERITLGAPDPLCPAHGTEAERKRAERAKARGWDAGWKRFDTHNAKRPRP